LNKKNLISNIQEQVNRLRNSIGNTYLSLKKYSDNYGSFSKYLAALDMMEDMMISVNNIENIRDNMHFYTYFVAVSQVLYIFNDQIISMMVAFDLKNIKKHYYEESEIKDFLFFRTYVNHPSHITNNEEGIQTIHIVRHECHTNKLVLHAYTDHKEDFLVKILDVDIIINNFLSLTSIYLDKIIYEISQKIDGLRLSSKLNEIIEKAIVKSDIFRFQSIVKDYEAELIHLTGDSYDMYELKRLNELIEKLNGDKEISLYLKKYIFEYKLPQYLAEDSLEKFNFSYSDGYLILANEDQMYSYYRSKLFSSDPYVSSIANEYILEFYKKRKYNNVSIRLIVERLLDLDLKISIDFIEFILVNLSKT